MQHLPDLQNKVKLDVQKDCHICLLAKKSRLKFPISVSKTTNIFQIVHIDVWGPYKISTYDKKYYFVTLVDDFSRYTWACLLHSKCEVIVVLRDFFSLIKNQFGTCVKILRSDNGIEFFNSKCNELLSSVGSSCPYTPQQNRVVERKHRDFLVSRDVRFREDIFPFKNLKEDNEDIFTQLIGAPIYSEGILTHEGEHFSITGDENDVVVEEDDTAGTGDIISEDEAHLAEEELPAPVVIDQIAVEAELSVPTAADQTTVEADGNSTQEIAHDPSDVSAPTTSSIGEPMQPANGTTELRRSSRGGDMYEEVYMDLPQGFHGQGESKSAYDHSMFTKKVKTDIFIILIYVDDILITVSNNTLVDEAKKTLHNNIKMKDLEELKYFLGIEIMRSKRGILLNQRNMLYNSSPTQD
ncbi:uncharacterized protein [Nicotiana sylvestris]|uniref:uncharacterized protein n=1 Tax=Nicotiana sylvestris TaxID=4096 RepID=UPI00388C84DE